MLFGFDLFELDLGTCELRLEGRPISLQPRVFNTLRYLVEHRDRVVSKQELIDALWGVDRLNAAAVPWTINRVRKALDDESRPRGYIQTVRGHGYRFVGEVRTSAARTDAALAPVAHPAEPLTPRHEEPFVGRDSIIRKLAAALDAAGEGAGGLCLLTGEAGIGKTRCANEFAALVRARGIPIWLGRSYDAGIAPAFWPFIQVLRAACNDGSLTESLSREGEALLRELEPSSTAPERTPALGDTRFWMLDRLSRFLIRSSRAWVRVLVLEDLHCADESSLRALGLLAPLLSQSRMLVLATAREPATSGSVQSVPSLATRLRPCEHTALAGLLVEDIAAYLSPALGDALASQLSPALRARTAGNPLFVREVARVVRAQWEREGNIRIEEVKLPQAIADFIGFRLQALDAPSRVLLEVACVIGEEFSVPVLQRASGASADAVLTGLQTAVSAHIVETRTEPSKYAFVHPLIREVLYSSLPTARRANLHAEVGLALEALGRVEPRVSELAFHFHRASLDRHSERAVRYARLAGDAAMSARAWDEGVVFYAWALAAQEQLGTESVEPLCELLLRRATALLLSGKLDESRRQCARAIELARAEGLASILVSAAQLLRPSVWFASLPNPLALQALEDAVRMSPDDASAERVRAYSQLAVLPPYSLQLSRSREMSAAAMELAGRIGDKGLVLEAQRARLFGLTGADTIDELLQVADEIVQTDPVGASRVSADAQLARYHALLRRGDVAGAEQALKAVERISAETGSRMMAWHCERLSAQRSLAAGRLDEAERRFAALKEDADRINLPLAAAYLRVQSFALNLARTGKRVPTSCQRPSEVEPERWVQRLPVYRTQRVLLMIETRDLVAALREFRSLAEGDFAAVSEDAAALYCLTQLAYAAPLLRDRDAALVLRDRLAPHAELNAFSPFTIAAGCVAGYLGVLERFLGRPERAAAQFEIALRLNEQAEQVLERMRVALELARLTTTPKQRARTLADEVRIAAASSGAAPLRAAAVRLLSRLGGVSREPADPNRGRALGP